MTYLHWFERRHDILEAEIESFEKAGLNFVIDSKKLTEQKVVQFNGEVTVNGKVISLKLVYPSEFPHFPIVVYAPDENLPRHQNPFGKNLCVVPHNSEWNSKFTGADMVLQAEKLFRHSAIGPEAVAENEVDAPEPWTNYIQFMGAPLLISSDIPSEITETGEFELTKYVLNNNTNQQYVLRSLHSLNNQRYDFEEFPHIQRLKPMNLFKGFYFKLSDIPNFDLYDADASLQSLMDLSPSFGEKVKLLQLILYKYRKAKPKQRAQMPIPHLALIFPEENYERNNYRLTFIFGMYNLENNQFIWSKPMFITIDEHFRRIPELKGINEKRVMIIGIGSLGSSVALELGKIGIGLFKLVDYDRLDAGNLVRHTGSINHLGLPKTLVLEQQIKSHFPFASVMHIHGALGRIEEDEKNMLENLYDQMQDVDLVIDCSADQNITRVLNRFAVELRVPIIHAWISNGAWAGRVLRYRPNKTGCYFCLTDSGISDLHSSAMGEIYPRGCGFPTFTGPSYDIYEIGMHVVRLAVDTLIFNKVDYDHIIINYYPSAVEVLKIDSINDCPVCGG